ncbi:hypothetical protein Taro_042889 [Colocasia esculenta]|uniref:Plastidal glycolate/glycerate translocator 1, chloroplastic n=1 Tax=Colocasia esculenta TaxID=4460 RepID=A0A843WXN1_COLES|nr:hypothetical protein [Colocasia esculenta]
MVAASAVRTLPPSCALSENTRLLRKRPYFYVAATSRLSRRSISPYALPTEAGAMAVPGRPFGEPWTGFFHLGSEVTRHRRRVCARYAEKEGGSGASTFGLPNVVGLLHLVVSLGLILAADKFLKRAFVAAAIKFPSALFGMFCVFTVLTILDSVVPSAAKGLMDFFDPATLFIQRWLPLFYVPSLVVLPLAVRDIPTSAGLKICIIFIGGWLASLCVAAYTTLTVRNIVKTEMIPAEPMSKPSPFSSTEIWTWTAVFIASFIFALTSPAALGTSARTNLPFLLAATMLGYMVGSGLPSDVKRVFHPIICCALSADLAAVALGYFSRSGMDAILGDYLTKAPSNPGAGDILMGFLGSVIISFAFSMFKQRKVCSFPIRHEMQVLAMFSFKFPFIYTGSLLLLQILVKRHAAEIFSAVVISTIFSLYSTAIIGRLIGLEPTLTISILPRCITVALALSIVSFFEGVNTSLTAAVVVLTGLVGANFVQAVLDKLGFEDPIARGIATASRKKKTENRNSEAWRKKKKNGVGLPPWGFHPAEGEDKKTAVKALF